MKECMQRSNAVARSILIVTLTLLIAGSAFADVYGRLRFSVRDADAIPGAQIVLTDSANVHPPVTLTTDANGNVTTDPLQARPWHIITSADTFQDDNRDVTIVADTTTDVEVLMDPIKEKVIEVKGKRTRVNPSQTTSSTHRTLQQQQKIPVGAGNPQSLSKTLRSVPGMAEDSAGQLHPRGEHSATSIYVNGFRLPGAFQGRADQVVTPRAIQNIDILDGAYAPEYGGETAAVLNVELRSGTLTPFQDFQMQGGSYKTFFGDVAFGGQVGQPYGTATDSGQRYHKLGYFLDFNDRSTNNWFEPPQPNDQTAHNAGSNFNGFGNFDYRLSDKDSLSFTAATSPSQVQIANRTGLPLKYAPFGQGFGFLGQLTQAEAEAEGIPSQEADGQDDIQRDRNDFGVIGWRRNISPNLTSFLSFGLEHSGLDTVNHNPVIDLNNLPQDNSIEYNPTIIRNAHSAEAQGSMTLTHAQHTYKWGFNYDSQSGKESYQLIPASVLALQDIEAIDPRFTPINGVAPTIFEDRKGHYAAAYVQDTYKASSRFTINYGLRYDDYLQDSLSNVNGGPNTPSRVSKSQISPRINTAYVLVPRTIGRVSFDRLFIIPPQAQGTILGSQIQPETYSQYEVSVEKEVRPGQVVKLDGYYKDIRHQIDTGLLVPGTQIGVFTSVNFDRGSAHALEFSYDFTPTNNLGWDGYLALTHGVDKPGGLDNTGAPVPKYNDHDELNLISAGGSYTWKDGSNAGLTVVHGSGLESSRVTDSANRVPHTEVNLQAASKPDLIGKKMGLQLDIENLFDERALFNFQSGFSGTRFQQGRRILLSLTGKF